MTRREAIEIVRTYQPERGQEARLIAAVTLLERCTDPSAAYFRAHALYHHGPAAGLRGDPKPDLRLALQADDADWHAHHLLGCALYDDGAVSDAKPHFQAVIDGTDLRDRHLGELHLLCREMRSLCDISQGLPTAEPEEVLSLWLRAKLEREAEGDFLVVTPDQLDRYFTLNAPSPAVRELLQAIYG